MPQDISEDPVFRRWLIRALIIVAMLVLLFAGALVISMRSYQQDFVGRREGEVIARIGTPEFDDRIGAAEPRKEFTLTWRYPLGFRLFLRFKDGVVVKQEHGSR